jgi:hypothetical protein
VGIETFDQWLVSCPRVDGEVNDWLVARDVVRRMGSL